ncbi:helix-turn-helix domain-containing protein [Pseudomonas leptonychotis]|uniref:helix-turn-helix domain-containing protein n=1 Tax=Pseudomonas leptonychotis TaxID=2448482 RepID=UPI003865F3FB
MTFSSLFCVRMQEERKRLKLKQVEVAAKCGVSREIWGRYERGIAVPGGEVLYAFANLGADAQYIFTGERRSQQKCPDVPADEQLLLDSYRGLTAAKKKQLLASLLTGDAAKKPAKSGGGVVVTGSGNKTAGRDYHE